MPVLKRKFESKEVSPSDPIGRTRPAFPCADAAASYITHFPIASKSHPYTVITPDTPLETLEDFFNQKGTDFALGKSSDNGVLGPLTHLQSPILSDDGFLPWRLGVTSR